MFSIYNGRECFYQWDMEQRLIVNDSSIDEVHFCNRTDNCALVCEVYEENSLRVVNVPNILLQNSWDINVFGYCNNCYTKNYARFKVKARSKPADYIYTETEIVTVKTLVDEAVKEALSSGEFIGLNTEEDGEIFNDYENNIAGCKGYKLIKAYKSEDRDGKSVLWVNVEGNVENEIDIASIEANRIALGLDYSVSLQWGNNYDLSCNIHKELVSYDRFNDFTDIVLSPIPYNFDATLATSGYIWFITNSDIGNIKLGSKSHAEGSNTKAIQTAAHAEGYNAIASGKYSHAEGHSTIANYAAHAEGNSCKALGQSSHAEGYFTTAKGHAAHAEGGSTVAEGKRSHAEGESTKALGIYSHAEGEGTEAGDYSHAEGRYTVASGSNSHAEGYNSVASGEISHAEGSGNYATGRLSHAEGGSTLAEGRCAHAEGNNTKALGASSHAEGHFAEARGEASHAEGSRAFATGYASHAEGCDTQANGTGSHAGGRFAQANGDYTLAFGDCVRAVEYAQCSVGKNNKFNNTQNIIFIVGNGASTSARSNAFEVYLDGHAELQTMGSTNNSIATKQYVDEAIAAIKKELLGGNN